MDAGRWIMIGLIVAGVVLMAAAIPLVVRAMNRINGHLNELEQSRLVRSAGSIQIEAARFQRLALAAQPLAERAKTAVESIRTDAAEFSQLPAHEALGNAGAQMSALLEDLR